VADDGQTSRDRKVNIPVACNVYALMKTLNVATLRLRDVRCFEFRITLAFLVV